MSDKPDVSMNDLEKDLVKGNERVQDYLTQHQVKQGAFDKDVKDSKQNDPKSAPEKTSDKLTALEVAEGAVKGRK